MDFTVHGTGQGAWDYKNIVNKNKQLIKITKGPARSSTCEPAPHACRLCALLLQTMRTLVAARRSGNALWVNSEGSSVQAGAAGRHQFGWRDAMDVVVKWRQLAEPNDQVRVCGGQGGGLTRSTPRWTRRRVEVGGVG